MINCPKCNAENMVGAIFCRTCGGRLNLDELRPESFNEAQDSVGKRVGIMVSRIATLVVVFAFVGIVVAAFLPPGDVIDSQSQFKSSELDHSLAWLMHPTRQYYRFKFTSEKATAMANQALDLDIDGSDNGNIKPVHISLDFQDDESIRAVLTQRMFGKIPFHAAAVTKIAVEDGETKIYLRSAKLGKLPMVGPLKAVVTGQFENALARSEHAAKLKQTLANIQVDEDEVQVSLRPAS